MKKYLPILLLMACNSSSEKASPVHVNEQPLNDSISLIVDSLKEWSENISDITSYTIQANSEIKKLRQENKELADKAGEVVPLAMMYSVPSDVKDKQIRDLVTERNFLRTENTRLKNIIYSDSVYRTRPFIGKKLQDIEYGGPLKPDDNSLVISLDKKIRGDGEIDDRGITVYIMPYTKKVKKAFKEYGNCDMSKLTGLDAKQAQYYQGQYFFNGIEPGEYLIKVCALWGDYKKIDYKGGYQVIAMKVAPPIQ